MSAENMIRLIDLDLHISVNENGEKLAKCEPRIARLSPELYPCPSEEQTLLLAVIDGDLETVKRLAKETPTLLVEPDRGGLYPIHTALIQGEIEIVDFLLDVQGPHVNWLVDPYLRSPLHLAAFAGYTHIVRRLVEDFGCEIEDLQKNDPEMQLLHMAARTGSIDVMRYLIEEMPEVGGRKRPSILSSGGVCVIFSTVVLDKLDAFLYCLDKVPGLDPRRQSDMMQGVIEGSGSETADLASTLLDDYKYPLYWSTIGYGATRIFRWMLDNNFDKGLNAKKPVAKREFLTAARYGSIEIMKLLRSRGFDIQADMTALAHKNPLSVAVNYEHLELLKYLVDDCGLDSYWVSPKKRQSLLNLSCMLGLDQIAKYLYSKQGRKIDIPGKPKVSDSMLLIWAAQAGHWKVMEWLIDDGICDVNYRAKNVFALSAAAVGFGDSETAVEVLIAKGADTTLRNRDPDVHATAFLSAAGNDNIGAMIPLLRENPAVIWDVEISDGIRHNALWTAVSEGCLHAAQFLMKMDPRREEVQDRIAKDFTDWPQEGLDSLQIVAKYPSKKGSWIHAREDDVEREERLATNPHLITAFSQLVMHESRENHVRHMKTLNWLIDIGADVNTGFFMKRSSDQQENGAGAGPNGAGANGFGGRVVRGARGEGGGDHMVVDGVAGAREAHAGGFGDRFAPHMMDVDDDDDDEEDGEENDGEDNNSEEEESGEEEAREEEEEENGAGGAQNLEDHRVMDASDASDASDDLDDILGIGEDEHEVGGPREAEADEQDAAEDNQDDDDDDDEDSDDELINEMQRQEQRRGQLIQLQKEREYEVMVVENQLICSAVSSGNLDAVKIILARCPDAQVLKDNLITGDTDPCALAIASAAPLELFECVYAAAVREAQRTTKSGATFLHHVLETETGLAVDPNVDSGQVGMNLLEYAFVNGNAPVVDFLVKKCGGKIRPLMNGPELMPIWVLASLSGSLEMWKWLETYFKEIDEEARKNGAPNPLNEGNVHVNDHSGDHGATGGDEDPKAHDWYRFNPLSFESTEVLISAIRANTVPFLEYLLDVVRIPPEVLHPRWRQEAFSTDITPGILEALYLRGVSLHGTGDYSGGPSSFLTMAAFLNMPNILKWAHQFGISLTAHDANGWSPISAACANGSSDLFHWLVRHGVPPLDYNPIAEVSSFTLALRAQAADIVAFFKQNGLMPKIIEL